MNTRQDSSMTAKRTSWRFLGLTMFFTLSAMCSPIQEASALVIVRHYLGGPSQPTAIGEGNLIDIFNAAADQWEQAIQDDHTITLHFGWAPIGGGLHTLNRQGGSPNREIEGTILFNNNTNPGNFQWWLDPTPHLNEEFQTYRESSQNLGGGIVNVSRTFSDPVGEYASGFYIDLFSVALHEIGHALGKSLANTSWRPKCLDGHIKVTGPRPYAGMVIPLASNNSGVTNHFHPIKIQGYPVMGSAHSGTRQVLSDLDILANAQISQFTAVNLDPLNLGAIQVRKPSPEGAEAEHRSDHDRGLPNQLAQNAGRSQSEESRF